MKPIINPWLIYLINLFDNLNVLLSVVLFSLGCAIVVLLIIRFSCFMGYNIDDNLIIKCKKYLKKSIIWFCISSLLFTVIPSKDTMYTMIVLDNVTTDNIQAIGKTGKDVVDYITDQIDKVVNDKEEDKK
jgi:hypothetical protein